MKAKHTILLVLVFLLFSCEEEVVLDLPEGEELLVVQGHIEQDAPPLVVLTRSVPVFKNTSSSDLKMSFIHGAQVTVSTGSKSYDLQELSITSFTPDLKRLLEEQFAVPPSLLEPGSGFEFFIYTTDELKGETGNSYRLEIGHGGRKLSASTTIPQLNPLTELFIVPHPDPKEDSLVSVYYRYKDPDTLGNSVRYFTKRNNEPFYAGLLTSVFNDELINGAASLTFPLGRGIPQGQEIDQITAGYFGRGDTVTIKWAAIDLAHFRFWSTLESERSSNGSPIGSPDITRSNIKGGLGIWGGYAATYHTIIVD